MVDQTSAGDKPVLDIATLQAVAEGEMPPEEAARQDYEEEATGRRSQRDLLIQLAVNDRLYLDPERIAYVSIFAGKHREFFPIRGRDYKSILLQRYYNQFKSAPSAQATEEGIRILEARATAEGAACDPRVRVSERDGCIYIDHGDPGWNCTKIDKSGWSIQRAPEALLYRRKGLLQLPSPEEGSPEDLQRFLHLIGIEDTDQQILLLSWLLSAMRPRGPYPILMVVAEQGSGKSTLCGFIRDLIDPVKGKNRSAPKDERDLVIAASNSHMVVIDNISTLQDWLSDALCRVATGGGLATRTLFQDAEETIFEVQRPIVLNGISDFASRGDLLDRAVFLNLPTIAESHRRPEDELHAEFQELRPRVQGALYSAMSYAIAHRNETQLKRLPRMADFAIWSTASEKALGFPAGAFMSAYEKNRQDVVHLSLESSAVAQAVMQIMEFRQSEELTAGAMLTALNRTSTGALGGNSWPRTPRVLSDQLRRIAPAMRKIGIEISFRRSHERLIRIERKG